MMKNNTQQLTFPIRALVERKFKENYVISLPVVRVKFGWMASIYQELKVSTF
jgi:hypothetical protein